MENKYEYAIYTLEQKIRDIKNFKKYGLDDEGFIEKVPELQSAIKILEREGEKE